MSGTKKVKTVFGKVAFLLACLKKKDKHTKAKEETVDLQKSKERISEANFKHKK
jgi:hypothetical protein